MKTTKAVLFSTQPVEPITLSTDTWVKLHGRWLLQETETDQLDYYVNGLRVQHAVKGTSSPH
jgi:hypothetical protein